MHRNPTPHRRMHRNHHPANECTGILPLTHEGIEIIIPWVHALESYPSHMNALKSWLLRWMHRNPTSHTYMHRNHHLPSKCTRIVPLTHECKEIIIPHVSAPESYPQHMNAPKSSFLRKMHRNPNHHTWMLQHRHSPSKCTKILPLTHECTKIVIPQVNAKESYPSHLNAPKSSLLRSMHRKRTPNTWMHRNHPPSSKCTGILSLKHECTEIGNPQVNAPKSYPSHMNAPKSSFLNLQHRNLTPHTWMHRNHHPSSKCTDILPLTHECTEVVIPHVNKSESYPSHMNASKWSLPQVNAPESYPSHMNAPISSFLR